MSFLSASSSWLWQSSLPRCALYQHPCAQPAGRCVRLRAVGVLALIWTRLAALPGRSSGQAASAPLPPANVHRAQAPHASELLLRDIMPGSTRFPLIQNSNGQLVQLRTRSRAAQECAQLSLSLVTAIARYYNCTSTAATGSRPRSLRCTCSCATLMRSGPTWTCSATRLTSQAVRARIRPAQPRGYRADRSGPRRVRTAGACGRSHAAQTPATSAFRAPHRAREATADILVAARAAHRRRPAAWPGPGLDAAMDQ